MPPQGPSGNGQRSFGNPTNKQLAADPSYTGGAPPFALTVLHGLSEPRFLTSAPPAAARRDPSTVSADPQLRSQRSSGGETLAGHP